MIIKKQLLRKRAIRFLSAGLLSTALFANSLMLPNAAAQIQAQVQTQIQAGAKTEFDTNAPVNISKDVDISADELEANLRKDIVIFVGNVVIRQKELTLNSDRVTVFYQNSANEKPSISRIDASGAVTLTTKTETITATWGIYDFADRIITLGGKVILKRDDGEINGTRLVYNLDTGLITIEGSPANNGRVKGQFILPDAKKEKKDD
ncbi:MAG: lipopolysaccharide transport periplasmic protein LptA [Alphaproteobacteria bacterium]|nr:MAG: lipopolysaccharide transport periplasmic protein LptA [Alphaproteobacteria bacterium]